MTAERLDGYRQLCIILAFVGWMMVSQEVVVGLGGRIRQTKESGLTVQMGVGSR